MDATTQLGGVYRPDNHALFETKRRLQDAGVRVTHPISHDFIFDGDNAYTFDPSVWSAYEIALDYYQSIATCDFHIVCNLRAPRPGYVGADTARAIVYAFLKGKPVLMMHQPTIADTVDPLYSAIIQNNTPQLLFKNILTLDDTELQKFLRETADHSPQYVLEPQEHDKARTHIQRYLREALMPPRSA